MEYWSSALFIPKSSFSAFILSKSQLLCPLMWLLWYWYSPKSNILNNVSHFLSELLFQDGVVSLQRAQFWSTNKQFDNTTFQKFVEEKYRNWGIVHQYILFKSLNASLNFWRKQSCCRRSGEEVFGTRVKGVLHKLKCRFIVWQWVWRLPNWKLWNWEH